MNRAYSGNIIDRVEYIRYLYDHTDEHPSAFDHFVLPLAVYDENGFLVRANKKFRSFTGITDDDIKNGCACIYDYLNKDNEGIISEAKKAFNGEEVVLQKLECPLCPASDGVKSEICHYHDAVFFPMIFEREFVSCSGVLFMDEATD